MRSPVSPSLSGSRSRTTSYASESLERALRSVKTHTSKLQRHLGAMDGPGVRDGEVAAQLLDAARLFAILASVLDDYDDMLPVDYLIVCGGVVEECGRFSKYLAGFIQRHAEREAVSRVSWYRIARSCELALPRAYLLLAVGQTFLALSDEDFAAQFRACAGVREKADILDDLQMQCCAVSDPIRGMALRNAFLTAIERYIPTTGGDDHQSVLTLERAVKFLLEEFSIVNRLWVRLRFSSADRHDLERRQLDGVVARPIALLSALAGLSVEVYTQQILPVLLLHVTGCRDDMAQEYLTECILQAFPREFNLAAVEPLLDAVSRFNMTVDIRRLVTAIINHILHAPDDKGDDDNDGNGDDAVLFDELWARIEGLLRQRVETSKAEEVILLCSPLLHKALAMAPFSAERVDRILDFVHQSGLQATAYMDADKASMIIGKVVDAVLEFVPTAGALFEMPSLWALLAGMQEETAGSCSLALLGRMVKDQVRVRSDAEVERIRDAFLMVLKRREGGEGGLKGEGDLEGGEGGLKGGDLEALARHVAMRDYAADCVFNNLLVDGDVERMVASGLSVCGAVLQGDSTLGALIAVPKAANAWLASRAKPDRIRSLLSTLRKTLVGRQVQPIVSRSQYEAAPNELKDNHRLDLYLHDSPSSVLVATHARCVEMWLGSGHNGSSGSGDDDQGNAGADDNQGDIDADLIYETIVECLMIFEEEVTEHHAQCRILRSILHLVAASRAVLAKADVSTLISTCTAHARKLIKIDERREALIVVLETVVSLAGKVETKVAIQLAEHLGKVLPGDKNLADLVRYSRGLVDYMLMTEPCHELGRIVYARLSQIESMVVAQEPIESPELRAAVTVLLDDWRKLGSILRPEYARKAIEEEERTMITGMGDLRVGSRDDEPDSSNNGDDDGGSGGDAGAFATFHPGLADFS